MAIGHVIKGTPFSILHSALGLNFLGCPGQVDNCLKSFPLINDLPDNGMISVQLFDDFFKSLPRLVGIYNLISEGFREFFQSSMVISHISITKNKSTEYLRF